MTRKLLVSFFALMASMVLAIGFIAGGILHLSLTGSPTVTVKMSQAGGLFAASPVTYRGVAVGKVQKMDIVGDHVEAKISLRTSLKIPANTKAQVRSLSPAGEQFLDLQPDSDSGPYLKDKSVIEATSVSIPESVAGGLETIKHVLDQVDPDTLKTVLDELSTGFTGTSGDLNQILNSSDKILGTLESIYPQTQRLLENANIVLKTGVDEQGNLDAFTKNAKVLASWLKSYDPKLRTILDQTANQLTTVDGLVNELRPILPSGLDNGVALADILAVRDPHLRQLFESWPLAFNSVASTFKNKYWQLDIEITKQKTCDYGTPRVQPTTTQKTTLNTDAVCRTGIANLQRGAAYAPPPTR